MLCIGILSQMRSEQHFEEHNTTLEVLRDIKTNKQTNK